MIVVHLIVVIITTTTMATETKKGDFEVFLHMHVSGGNVTIISHKVDVLECNDSPTSNLITRAHRSGLNLKTMPEKSMRLDCKSHLTFQVLLLRHHAQPHAY